MRICITVISLLAVTKVTFAEMIFTNPDGMFIRVTDQVLNEAETDTRQKNYGIAVSDVNHDGNLDWIVAGFGKGRDGAPNLVLSHDETTGKLVNIAEEGTAYEDLRDIGGAAIGVCACDIDGDGREEIYFLNTNGAFGGKATYGDKLFKWRDGRYVDLFSDEDNTEIGATMYAGRSVACVDRLGTGKYGFVLATYAWGSEGNFGLIEMDEDHPNNNVDSGRIVLQNAAVDAGIAKPTGGRGITVGPILNDEGRSDIFFDNEGGSNFMFKNDGDGTFTDHASSTGILDSDNHGRGVALADFNGDGLIDIVYGNWNGPHRLFIQKDKGNGRRKFKDIATDTFSSPSAVRTVIAADFNNDGDMNVMVNNIVYRGMPQPNRLFRVFTKDEKVKIRKTRIGDAEEPMGYGTGGAAADVDGDGVLEMILAHGESNEQPLEVYHVRDPVPRYLRVSPLTRYGAPARGALVTVTMGDGSRQTRVIDGGSGYLCQMEPVAHFGLGEEGVPVGLSVTWPDTEGYSVELREDSINQVLVIQHPSQQQSKTVSTGQNNLN